MSARRTRAQKSARNRRQFRIARSLMEPLKRAATAEGLTLHALVRRRLTASFDLPLSPPSASELLSQAKRRPWRAARLGASAVISLRPDVARALAHAAAGRGWAVFDEMSSRLYASLEPSIRATADTGATQVITLE